MAIQNATDVVLKIDTAAGSSYETILYATSASLSISRDLRDSTTKSSAGWQENLSGLKSWELSSDSFVNFTSATGLQSDEIIAEMLAADPKVTVQFGVVGTKTYTGEAFITSVSMDAGVEENATFSVSLQGTGALS
tara:strand:+ start:2083 stop:2490 length:408 start_codon:yes stop_codon:yes gene_type:complete